MGACHLPSRDSVLTWHWLAHGQLLSDSALVLAIAQHNLFPVEALDHPLSVRKGDQLEPEPMLLGAILQVTEFCNILACIRLAVIGASSCHQRLSYSSWRAHSFWRRYRGSLTAG